jgi:hypothetical protein
MKVSGIHLAGGIGNFSTLKISLIGLLSRLGIRFVFQASDKSIFDSFAQSDFMFLGVSLLLLPLPHRSAQLK